jgi:hypothetical protein
VVLVLIAIMVAFSAGTAGPEADAKAAAAKRPSLEVTFIQPVTVVGRGFKAREHIRISADGSRKSVRATATGGFIARLVAVDPCNAFAILAVGNRGSRASLAYHPTWRVHCAAP